jgi:eukaryotic-like serine/threonine-protein kinase
MVDRGSRGRWWLQWRTLVTAECEGPSAMDRLGVSIGNYTIIEKVGEGGMGAVYRAVHETLGRSAAVKMLLPATANQTGMAARLFNEARSAAAIRHPGIVEIYDVGVLPDQTAYIVMEFLEGESLAARLHRERDLPLARGLQIMRAVARSLQAAHDCGIVHRDLKPDNVFLVPDPEVSGGERVKLLDFGIAKPEVDRQPSAEEYALTQTGMMIGTPPYMSPEQCRGTGPVDRRSDLYALGCLLYTLVCGRPPFVARGAGEIIARHLYFAPEPPRRHGRPVATALEALILWLLRKDPRDRPATASQVVAAIDRLDVTALSEPPAEATGSITVPMESIPTLVAPISELQPAPEPARRSGRRRSSGTGHTSRRARR